MVCTKCSFKVALLLLGVAGASMGTRTVSAQIGKLPAGWQAFEAISHEYSAGADLSRRAGGQGFAGVTMRSNVAAPEGGSIVAQSIRADDFRGKRVRLSGFIRTATAVGATTYLWMRIDGAGIVQSSDFMKLRPVRGTSDWMRQDIVLEVPPSAVGITFGFWLNGAGQAWLDDVAFEIVGPSSTLTGDAGGLFGVDTTIRARKQLAALESKQWNRYRLSPRRPVNLSLK